MKPAAVILDLLRTYAHRGTTVKTIMATGAMFGLSENVMRVNLSRLVSKGTVENFERGFYRLTDLTDPVNEFVERWRLGEARVRTWDERSWLLVHASSEPASKRSWALDATGFREVSDGLWLRPDNLAISYQDLEALLISLGIDKQSVLVESARLHHRWQDAWLTQFDVDQMIDEYRRTKRDLETSQRRLGDLSREDALKETFHLGGKAVHILAKDPLMPETFMNPGLRQTLWQSMLVYDRVGRDIWGEKASRIPIRKLEAVP